MSPGKKIGALLVATVVAVTISAAPASAAGKPALPSVSSLGAYCKQIKDPKLAAACTQATSGKSINIQSLLAQLGGGKTGGINIQSLLSQLGGGKTGGFNIQSLLGQLGGGKTGGLNLSGLLGGLKG